MTVVLGSDLPLTDCLLAALQLYARGPRTEMAQDKCVG